LREREHVTWSGAHRPALSGQGIYPRGVQTPLPAWVAVGGTPESVARAAALGLPMALAIIGGMLEQFKPHAEFYEAVWRESGHDPDAITLSINAYGFIADDSCAAADESWPAFEAIMNTIGKERGWSRMNRGQFERLRGLLRAYFVGSPDEIVEKILFQHQIFGYRRLLLQLGVGALGHASMMRAIELLGTKVAPALRKALG
jgi:alkanesulfonate monooxygenase SsuD/methylene tetrahydromethanopterin reductase-like flavin-dependent oxidoreductase (luciferase family)